MACKQYQERLIEAALHRGCEAALNEHLRMCPVCLAEVEDTRELARHIDEVLRRKLDAEPSPGFAAGVTDRIAREQADRQTWFTGWVPVAAGALSVILVVLVWFGSRRRPADGRRITVSSGSTARDTRPKFDESLAFVARPRGTELKRTIKTTRIHLHKHARRSEPQVIVDKNQWPAIVRLYNDIWSGRVDGASLVAKQEDNAAPKPIEIRPIRIPELRAEFDPVDAPTGLTIDKE
jgi:hypothetical protein